MKAIVILITCAKKREARLIARKLLEKKLAACVNIIDKVESFFWWQGKIDRAKEVLLIVKSKRAKLTKIIQTVSSIHSYEVPELIALEIISGYRPYLEWLNESVR